MATEEEHRQQVIFQLVDGHGFTEEQATRNVDRLWVSMGIAYDAGEGVEKTAQDIVNEGKDRAFAESQESGVWPNESCKNRRCEVGGCCQSAYHHLGDCCLHCGLDERSATGGPL